MATLTIEKVATKQPVTLADVKTYLRISPAMTEEDSIISGVLIPAATALAEAFTNRCFCFKGYRECLDSFPYFTDTVMSQNAFPPSYYALPRYSTTLWNYSQMIKLFAPPLASVDRITYLSSKDSQWHDLVPVPRLWYPNTVYDIDDEVMDNNGNVQQLTTPGTSNANPPAWNRTVGGVTSEGVDPLQEGTGNVQWTNMGPFPPNQPGQTQGQFGAYLTDTDSEPARIFPGPPGNFWPQVLYVPNAVQIHFTAGYSEDGTNVPAGIKQAIMMTIAHWHENREAVMLGQMGELPNHAKALLWSWRVLDFQPTRG